jgi:hydroxymethylglutaryl-CoA reductase
MDTTTHWSRVPGFFSLDISQRREILKTWPIHVDDTDLAELDRGLSLASADAISENVIGTFALPLSCAVNFVVDEQPLVVPMAIEEPSIVAACSKMAKLTSENGGFTTTIGPPLITGQIQFFAVPDVDKAIANFLLHKESLLSTAKKLSASIESRGGGVVDINARVVPSAIGPMILVELTINVVDAMGANLVNTIVEGLSCQTAAIIDGRMGVRILSNLCDKRLALAQCRLRFDQMATDDNHDNGMIVAGRMRAAHALAEADIFRACTHNKGIMNGIDAVAIATGNDFRAIEAGAHAYAARAGAYGPLTSVIIDDAQRLVTASLSLPLAVGVVGGLVKMHPGVKLAHALLGPFAKNSQKLAAVMVSAGLSQCLAALLALSQDGIQKGHMKLHKKKLACAVDNPR